MIIIKLINYFRTLRSACSGERPPCPRCGGSTCTGSILTPLCAVISDPVKKIAIFQG